MEPTREPTLNLLSSKDFSPDKYVRDLSQSCVGGPELRRLRKKIQSLSEDTNSNLKRNVYQNYVQFIDTAKEISHLESEMYQLSHMLSEQKGLLSALATTSILGIESPVLADTSFKENENHVDDNKQRLASIIEKVDGCKEIVETPGRIYLHEGDLLEVDAVDNNTIKTIHAYLFTDGFMTAYRNKDGSVMKYTFEMMYDLGSLAVVNVRDIAGTKHQFKVLSFPETRVFQCTSNTNKKDWLDKFDQAKKARLNQDPKQPEIPSEKSPSRMSSLDSPSINPFDEVDEEPIHPPWFLDTPEELDVCVAQRHFEEALEHLKKAKEYIYSHPDDNVVTEMQKKLDQRTILLTEVLMKELEVNQDKSLQGGLRAARRAVRLLNKLGRSIQACDLFLKLCSSMLKAQVKRVKREGSTIIYVRHLASVVFSNMCHMTEEFLRAFPKSPNCFSAYVVWASSELSGFSTHFIKQVFMPQTSLSTLTDCVVLVRSQCERLCTYGVDLSYQLDGALRAPLVQALKDARDKALDSAKVRAFEDKWIPMNLRTKASLTRFLQEFSDVGIDLHSYITGDVWIQLTPNTIAFTKLFLKLFDDSIKLATTELLYNINETLYDVMDVQLRHIDAALRNEVKSEQRQFITKNAEFILQTLVQLCQNKYSESIGLNCTALEKLKKEYSALGKGVAPTSRNTKKYSSDFL